MELKKPMTIEEQLAKMKAHGMAIGNEKEATRILSEINYYRLTGYVLQYRKEADKSEYVSGLTFNTMCQIYAFDEAIRDILRKYVEKVEIYYRTLISYSFSIAKCVPPPHDQHYDEANFFNKTGYAEVMDSFQKERNYYKDSLIVKHHKQKYGNKMPLWVIVELISFSNVSKLYNAMYLSEKQQIADVVGVGTKKLENHLHCLAVLRNKCAHAARLYNTEFNPPAQFTKQFLKKHPEIRNNTLFAYVSVLLKHLPDPAMKAQLASDISIVLDKFAEDIDLALIGFPQDYQNFLNQHL